MRQKYQGLHLAHMWIVLFVLVSMPTIAYAELIDRGNTTFDSATGLEWLDLTFTVNRSFVDVAAQFGPGGEFSGWRHANLTEVDVLFRNAGFAVTDGTCRPEDLVHTTALLGLIGITFSDSRSEGAQGLVSTLNPGGPGARYVLTTGFERPPFVCANKGYAIGQDAISAGSSPSMGETVARSFTGSFLVRVAPVCGDGTVTTGEECDDGNLLVGDGCRPNCTQEICGDGVLDPQEQCDDGNLVSGDGCQANCADPFCGDAILDAFLSEQCDDGNTLSADGCSMTCGIEVCGNGVVDDGEECDDGNSQAGDGCRPNCLEELCGDAILDPQERCDDGNNLVGDGCREDCTEELCGDGSRDPQEQCDDGNVISGDGCQAGCMLPICGDFVVDPGEHCDDGNLTAGDGCSSSCAIEVCGNGTLDPGEQCDDGNGLSGDGCRAECSVETCGDGTVDPQEQCDDGNLAAEDGCSDTCVIEEVGGGEGCSPGYWKQPHHFTYWPADIQPTTPFASIFEDAFPGMTLLNVLQQGGGGLKALGRQVVAAYLNARSSSLEYDLMTHEVVGSFNLVHPASISAYETLKNVLEQLNGQGCPLE
ncbi:MAG TPA: DUF4215 domain-containing protein [Candidatus Polarisedimenticolaceae bacterium]|nr:DUF4215 domain-containing protein [Candidatus Polarisedimenticolaceae bacterium]